jgi:aldehyde:ferredoxin oxidoreductase
MGSAIFWDLCEDKTIDGFDPKNVITIMTSPLSGTLAPTAGSRCEVQGIGVQPHPIGWFTRSGFGGRFAPMLKAAGWDGIVIEGKASSQVWINIVNDQVTLEDASGLWGMDTWSTQQEIWRIVGDNTRYNDFWQLKGGRDAGRTTQRPAVLSIGPAGENLSRIGALVHDAGSGAGQGGFGGIFGSKKLKAISVIGTGSVQIADPAALMATRQWMISNHSYNVDNPLRPAAGGMSGLAMGRSSGMHGDPNRINGCFSCPLPCRRRHQTGLLNDSQCVETYWYAAAMGMSSVKVAYEATDMIQKLGINAYDLIRNNFLGLAMAGLINPSPVDVGSFGQRNYAHTLTQAIAYRQGIGDDLAEGLPRANERWGTLEAAYDNGSLPNPAWGYPWHWTLPEVTWAYGTLLGDRDINEHDFLFPFGTYLSTAGALQEVSVQSFIDIVSSKMTPYQDDKFLLDHNWQGDAAWETGVFSSHKAKKVAFHRHWTRFWKQSMQFCDWAFPNFFNAQAPDWVGWTPTVELQSYEAVTGKSMTYEESMELGRKIWNLDNAVWVLQGRHRDMVKFAPFMNKERGEGVGGHYNGAYPVYENGTWRQENIMGMWLDYQGVEDFKTHFYTLEGWNTSTGWPTRSTLSGLGLDKVADALSAAGKLGS